MATRAASAKGVDCDQVDVKGLGPFGDMSQFNSTDEDGKIIFIFHPDVSSDKAFYPVMIFSHGSTGEWAMYEDALKQYVSHGFVVVFPHLKGPQEDTSALSVDPLGGYTLKGFHYALQANSNQSNPLKGHLDLANIVLVGHSMGGTATIMTAQKLPVGSVKLAYAQHPGVCGPWGPPPCIGPTWLPGFCNTWMPSDLKDVASKMPVVISTATNDNAFWPAPATAQHEFGCFNSSTNGSDGTAFVQFSTAVCMDDGKGGRYNRKWSNGGHDCPMKDDSPETPWVIVAAKLYAQLDGDASSKCYAMLWGADDDSLRKDPAAKAVVVYPRKLEITV